MIYKQEFINSWLHLCMYVHSINAVSLAPLHRYLKAPTFHISLPEAYILNSCVDIDVYRCCCTLTPSNFYCSCLPSSPMSPCIPRGPLVPFSPWSPAGPGGPISPLIPLAPLGPSGPTVTMETWKQVLGCCHAAPTSSTVCLASVLYM